MRFFVVLLTALAALAEETPLTVLPYTPGLDTQFMDRAADPCTDFYKYACGNWNKMNPIPADQARWNVYSKLANENLRFLWGILDQAARPSASRTSNEQKIGDFFHACMDQSAVEQAGDAPIEPMLEGIADLKSTEDIAVYVAEEHKSGVDRNVLFGLIPARTSTIRPRRSRLRMRAGWGCRTAITTQRPMRNRRRSGSGTFSMSSGCFR